MFAIFFSLIFFLLSAIQVNAFTYSTYLEISSVPLNEDVEDSITYNQGDVKDEGKRISMPPNSEVVFGVEGNLSNINANVRIFLSKDNIYQGDLTKILNIELPYSEVSFQKNGNTYYRYGRMFSLENISFEDGRNDLLTISLDQPLKVLEYAFEISNGLVNVKTVLKNDTDRLLNNIVYTHEQFSLTRNFQPGEEYIYGYVLEYDEGEEYVDLGFPRIYDSNIKQICAAGTNTVGNPHTIFLGESGTTYFDIGTEEYEDVCITQLAYTLNLGRIEVGEKEEESSVEEGGNEEGNDNGIGEEIKDEDIDEEVMKKEDIEEEVVEEEDIEDVLGINILPKTAMQSYGYIFLGIFLVALGILCYYLTNENTIHNA